MYTCPICGYPNLPEAAYDEEVGSLEFCPCCSFQFGVTDYDRGISHEAWRKQWIEGGMVWDEGDSDPPEGWDPKKQLLNIGVTATR